MGAWRIRAAWESDLVVLRDVERSAGYLFAEAGMDFVAEDEPPTVEELREFVECGRAWVGVDGENRSVGYLLAGVVDGNAHLEQVSVRPEHMRRGIGRALLERLIAWSRERELPAITLTTYVEVPWNGPYYERCGFRFLTAEEETPGLRRIRADEIARGLDRWPRACMRRDI
ncbi:GNAT family N-acetyltransferase [Saccharopolyspora griseoalba]|uniref:GNAT family N-acetyltransferase n=1 Tax=Saccharopolyspora griseoalba TaxID=1431848 RepID=A0ABW2LES9_9PSEU